MCAVSVLLFLFSLLLVFEPNSCVHVLLLLFLLLLLGCFVTGLLGYGVAWLLLLRLHFFWYNLRELFYDRNRGDARVKVGSERKFASRPGRPTDSSPRSAISLGPFARGDPPKLALL